MKPSNLTAESVLRAIERYDELGQDDFLEHYHFKPALEYFLLYGGKAYDSKAIAGVAHGFATNEFKESGDFSGGLVIARALRGLGFEVTGGTDWEWDEIVLACDLVATSKWQTIPESDPRVSALSQFLRAQPNARYSEKFRSAGSVHRKLEDLRTAHPDYDGKTTRGGKTTRQVVESFVVDPAKMHRLAQALWANGDLARPELDDAGDADGDEPQGATSKEYAEAVEGRVVQRLVKTRERDPRLRRSKIAQSRKDRGSIACEICGFDFERRYGELGEGFTHVHHKVPLHFSGEVKSTLDDLILVCVNCHQMIHRRSPWKTPDELRQIITAGVTTS
ncbi:HNH endonuclease [Rhodococcus erythropolis]|uniref:HNH endonuclease n=1 Tax=Rhodococcus erythropolis TaxID=1833 RepID=UPI00406BCEFA